MSEALHTLYRPKRFEHVAGHKATITALKRMAQSRESQAFLFYGPSGVGKTTIARIMALEMGSDPSNILELDGATYSGVEKMREITDLLQYRAFGSNPSRSIIIDECHRLSPQAWDASLKAIEEPPEHIVWFLCTTNVDKVPPTIRTRCQSFKLDLLTTSQLDDLMWEICKEEKIELPRDVFDLAVREARGSPRQLLVNLALIRDVTDRKEAAELLRTLLESDAVVAIARLALNGGSWPKAMALVNQLVEREEKDWNGVRIAICNYIGKVVKGAKNDDEAIQLLNKLEAFSQPYIDGEREIPLVRSIGRALF